MPRTKAKPPEKHVAVVHAEAAQERITAQKPKPKTSAKPKKIEPPETEEPLFPPAKLPTPFELADAISVIKTAIEANKSALATFKRIFDAPWVIATDAPGNLFEQVYNIVTDEKLGLCWAIADMEDVLEDLADGPEQGKWVTQVFMPQPEAPKSKCRKRTAK